MPELDFAVEGAEPVPFAAAPLLAFKVRVSQAAAAKVPIQTIVLRCQLRIEPTRRRYGGQEPEGLRDLFGEPALWGRSLRSMLWAHVSAIVPAFIDSTVVDLLAPCSFDFNVAATKFFHALEDGDVPLSLLFSGTVFYDADDGGLQAAPISWEKDAAYRLPVRVWKELMDQYYPNSAWLRLRRDVFERLYQYKSRSGLATWEQTLESLLAYDEQVTR